MGRLNREGMLTFKVFWRRDSVLKSGTSQSRPAATGSRRSRFAMVARTRGATWLDLPERHPKQHLHRRQVWIAAAL